MDSKQQFGITDAQFILMREEFEKHPSVEDIKSKFRINEIQLEDFVKKYAAYVASADYTIKNMSLDNKGIVDIYKHFRREDKFVPLQYIAAVQERLVGHKNEDEDGTVYNPKNYDKFFETIEYGDCYTLRDFNPGLEMLVRVIKIRDHGSYNKSIELFPKNIYPQDLFCFKATKK